MSNVVRSKYLAEKVVFVDGLPGCGKTLFSTVISAMDRVELLSYSYEIEHICQLYYLDKITIDAAKIMVSMQTDLRVYNTMMGRDVNFRPSDLSSVIRNSNPAKYFQRLWSDGDEQIPALIQQERPILNFSVHNMLAYSVPVWEALGNRCVFIEIVRHPLYMVRQQLLNMENLIGDVRDFTVYYENNGHELIYYAKEWESNYINSSPIDRVVHFIDNLTKKTSTVKNELEKKYKANVITIPFEPFVLNPDRWMEKIADILETNILNVTRKVMKEQNIPRNMVAQGVDLDIYRRCGWKPPENDTNERDELNIRREDIVREASNSCVDILDRLCEEYEAEYWGPTV